MVYFYKVSRDMLQERADIVKAGGIPEETGQRDNFFYECRQRFLKLYPQFTEPDSKEGNKCYKNWISQVLVNWCIDHAEELGVDLKPLPGGNKRDCLWWHVRDKLNIRANPRAMCFGAGKPFGIDWKTRDSVVEGRSLILLCEKYKMSRKIEKLISAEGYKINVVSTSGYSTADVVELVIGIVEEMKEVGITNFWFLTLHDYDLNGVEIYYKLKQWGGECIVDVGVNQAFLKYLKSTRNVSMRMIEERVTNKNDLKMIKSWMKQTGNEYSNVDVKYLQDKRIEIGAIEVEHGVEPFIEFIVKTIKDKCKVWDLSRIGVRPFRLDQPESIIESEIGHKEAMVEKEFKKVEQKLLEPKEKIIRLLGNKLDRGQDFDDLILKYFTNWGGWDNRMHSTNKIREDYYNEIHRDYEKLYNFELQEINDQIEIYEGDVREAYSDLSQQLNDLQEELNDNALDSSNCDSVLIDLDIIETGEDELENITINSMENMLAQAIEILTEELESIKDNDEENDIDIDDEDDLWSD